MAIEKDIESLMPLSIASSKENASSKKNASSKEKNEIGKNNELSWTG